MYTNIYRLSSLQVFDIHGGNQSICVGKSAAIGAYIGAGTGIFLSMAIFCGLSMIRVRSFDAKIFGGVLIASGLVGFITGASIGAGVAGAALNS